MCELIAVTNRKLCAGDFLKQIQVLAEAGVDKIILREKDLTPEAYLKLAAKVLAVCEPYETECILHNFVNAAEKLNIKKIHFPLEKAIEQKEMLKGFCEIGCSIHSLEQLRLVEALNRQLNSREKVADIYVTAGHIFATDCKKGIPPRGLDFLQMICDSTKLPVYAIGGITPQNVLSAVKAGAAGACLMSWCMNVKKEDVVTLKKQLSNKIS